MATIAAWVLPAFAEPFSRHVWVGRYPFNAKGAEDNHFTTTHADAFRFAQERMQADMRRHFSYCAPPTITFLREENRTPGGDPNYYGVPFWRVDYLNLSGINCTNTTTLQVTAEVFEGNATYESGPTDERTCKTTNPVQPGTGRKRFSDTDYAGAGAHPLTLVRHFSSRWTDGTATRGLAAIAAYDGGWRLNWQASLTLRSDGSLRAFRPDGSMLGLASSSANAWTAVDGRDGVVAILDGAGLRTGFTYTAAEDDSAETYDAAGKLLSVRQRNGWVMTLSYSDASTPLTTAPRAGLLIAVRNQFGRELRFVYDGLARIVEVLPPGAIAGQPAGATNSPIQYRYEEAQSLSSGVPTQGQLTSLVWQDGAVRRWHYEDGRWPQAVTGITDEAGVRYGTYAYDEQGRVTRSELAGGTDRLEFAYGSDAAGNPTTTVTDYASGSASSRSYTFADIGGMRYPSSVSAPCSLCGNTQQQSSHDAQGRPTRTIAHDGTITFHAYNAKGQETERATFPASFNTATTRPALANATRVVSTKWHGAFNLPTQVAEPGKFTANTYNAKGMLTGQSWTATTDTTGAAKFNALKTGSTYATGWGYNANSLVTSWVERVDSATVAQMTYVVNASGNATRATNPIAGQSATNAVYDVHGRLTQETDTYGTVTRSFTPRGFVLQEADEAVTTTVLHNAIGLVTEVSSGTGYVWNWTYKPNHRVQSVTLNGAPVATYASAATNKAPKSLLDLFVSTAHAQSSGATLPGPAGGGLRGPGWAGAAAPLLWELGKRIKDSALPAEGGPDKDENCDPCKDPSKRPRWNEYDSKHRKNRGQAWSDIRAKTALPPPTGAATYHPAYVPNATMQQAFEYDVWQRGKVIVNEKSKTHKVVRFGYVIGAYNGTDTTCAIVKCGGGEIHGHPTKESDCSRPEVSYP